MSGNGSSNDTFDYIVVGGGTAGCVMAARLSEDEKISVLLIEAGADSDANDPASPLRDASQLVLDGYNWNYEANLGNTDRFTSFFEEKSQEDEKKSVEKLFAYKAGKVMGGSSAVNGAVALRGFPSDFDQWASMGCPSWSWDKMQPWFNRLETDLDFSDRENHGKSGPLRIRRPTPEELHPLDAAFSEACQEHEIPYVDDLNTGEETGVGLVPSNVGNNAERLDIYRSYLEPVLKRDNLNIITNAVVARVNFVENKARSVTIVKDGKEIHLNTSHVVLCAGTIGTAALLQRSGIGDSQHLKALDIPVVADLPAVGKNLQDHSAVVLWALPREGVCTSGLPWRQVAARLSSGYDSKVDVQIGLLNNVSSRTVPRFSSQGSHSMLVGASVMLMRPEARGRVFINSKSPEVPPTIDFPIKNCESDIKRIIGGVRKIWNILKHSKIDPYLEGIQIWSDSMINNDAVMYSAMKNLVNPGWHASGTVCMGSPDNPDTVAQENGNIHGLESITVADASLFPCIPSMPTNLTTIMVAERIANLLLGREHYEL